MRCTKCGKSVIWFDSHQLTHGPDAKLEDRQHRPVVEGVTNENGVVKNRE